MAIVKGDTVTPAGFTTVDPYTGAETNASATSAYCYENTGTTKITTGVSVNDLTATETGSYSVTVDTSQAGFSAGNSYNVWVEATVNSVTSAPLQVFSFGLASTATVSADVVSVSGDTTAADNLELDYDGTGYAKSNSTVGTVTDITNAVTPDNASDTTAILADTNELQGDWVNGGRLDLILDAVKAITDQFVFTVANQVDANALTGGGGDDAATIWGYATRVLTAATNLTDDDAAVSNTDISAILTDTGTTLPASLATIDTNVDAILVDTGTTLPAQISGLNDPTASAIADAVLAEDVGDHKGTIYSLAWYINMALSALSYNKSVSDTGDGTIKWYDAEAGTLARTITLTTSGDERTLTGS